MYTKFEKFIKNNIRLFSVITISNEIKILNDVKRKMDKLMGQFYMVSKELGFI